MTGVAKEHLRNAAANIAAQSKGDYPKPGTQDAAWTGPGRLGNPKMELGEEPRANTQMMEFLSKLGMNKDTLPANALKLNENSSLDDIAALVAEFEQGIYGLYHGVPMDLPEDKDAVEVKRSEETIKGGDGQDMLIYIYRPANQDGPLPSVVYTHGGGMVLVPTMNPVHDWWCKDLAAQGLVVFMPDFRNAYTKSGYNHFPKGLNDCVAAVKWISEHRDSLKVRNIVLQGESGGGNLACATTLKANREGWVKDIAGVYGIVPYISNAYGWSQEQKLRELPSLVECSGYFLNASVTAFLGHFYAPTDEGYKNPLAWPYHATLEDMKGLPPHILVMDELDMLRDEGISYARRLVQAGVKAKGSVNLGVIHGTSLIFRAVVPEFHKGAVRDIAAFAKSL